MSACRSLRHAVAAAPPAAGSLTAIEITAPSLILVSQPATQRMFAKEAGKSAYAACGPQRLTNLITQPNVATRCRYGDGESGDHIKQRQQHEQGEGTRPKRRHENEFE